MELGKGSVLEGVIYEEGHIQEFGMHKMPAGGYLVCPKFLDMSSHNYDPLQDPTFPDLISPRLSQKRPKGINQEADFNLDEGCFYNT